MRVNFLLNERIDGMQRSIRRLLESKLFTEQASHNYQNNQIYATYKLSHWILSPYYKDRSPHASWANFLRKELKLGFSPRAKFAEFQKMSSFLSWKMAE